MSDDSTNRVYLQNPIEIEHFMSKMEEMNVYYNNLNAKSNDEMKKLLNEITRSVIGDDLKNGEKLYCAKWETDGPWYRVKFLKELKDNPDQLVVFFVDFGNKTVVNLTDFLVIPDDFEEFANLPYQVNIFKTEMTLALCFIFNTCF